jgi:hypothetical protein
MTRAGKKRGAIDREEKPGLAKKARTGKEAATRHTRRSQEPLVENTGEPERLLRQQRRRAQEKPAKASPRAPRQSRRKESQTGRQEERPAPAMERRLASGSGAPGAGDQQVRQRGSAGMCDLYDRLRGKVYTGLDA